MHHVSLVYRKSPMFLLLASEDPRRQRVVDGSATVQFISDRSSTVPFEVAHGL
jgi:hypothetical protein